MKFTHPSLVALAIAAALAATACNREAETQPDPAMAPDAAAPADGMPADGMTAPADTSGTMATDPAAPPAMDPAMGSTAPDSMAGTGSNPMNPPAPTSAPATVAGNDKNADGGLSMDELPQGDMLREHFSAADGDGNGMLSQAEIDKHNADMAAKPAQ